jgi:hypothetical protein
MGDLPHQHLRGLVEIIGDLHREAAPRTKLGDECREQSRMIGHPMQYGVGENQVHIVRLPGEAVCPFHDVGDLELQTRQARARGRDHVGGTVDSGDPGVRKARCNERGGISGAAAEIDGRAHPACRDSRQKITGRTRALLFESDVLSRRPGQAQEAAWRGLPSRVPVMDMPRCSGPNIVIRAMISATDPTTRAIAMP